MNNVYVIQNVNGKNLLPAKEYGAITILLTGKESRGKAISILQETLSSFQSDDYLLLIGDPVYIGIACYIVMTAQKRVNVLVWDKQHYRYNKETICH